MTEESLKVFEQNKVLGAFFKFFLGTPLKLWASVGHWAIWHFDLSKYKPKEHPRVSVQASSCPRNRGEGVLRNYSALRGPCLSLSQPNCPCPVWSPFPERGGEG